MMLEFGLRNPRGGRQLMARSETVTEKPMFKELFKKKRCLIFANGFYDGAQIHGFMQPWLFQQRGGGTVAFAGLRRDNEFTIMSTAANSFIAKVIDRMPAILPQDMWESWLAREPAPNDLLAMLKVFPSEQMEGWPVAREVFKGMESPDCIKPIPIDQPELGVW